MSLRLLGPVDDDLGDPMAVAEVEEVGLATALPYAAAALTMYLWGRHSDLSRERTWHVALPAFVGALGLALSAYWSGVPALALAALCLTVMGCYAALPVFWTLPTTFLVGAAAASRS